MARNNESSTDSAETLVLRARRGEADAFSELIGRYERMALSVAFSVLGNADSAGDVVQEAFVNAWQRIGDLKEPARFATWLCGIARNLAIDVHRRGRNSRLSIDAQGFDAMAIADHRPAADPTGDMDRRERNARVAEALGSLNESTRTAVIMRYYDGLSSKQIGEAMNLSPAAVDMRLSRAREQLKQLLEPAEGSIGN